MNTVIKQHHENQRTHQTGVIHQTVIILNNLNITRSAVQSTIGFKNGKGMAQLQPYMAVYLS